MTTNPKPHYTVVAAAITCKDESGATKIFCAQRPGPKPGKAATETNYKWEFPGGKIEPGETPQQALAREIREELGGIITVGDSITTVDHEYQTFSITMHAYWCTLNADSPELTLHEHLDSRWLTSDQLSEMDWAPADVPIVKKVQSTLA